MRYLYVFREDNDVLIDIFITVIIKVQKKATTIYILFNQPNNKSSQKNGFNDQWQWN